MCFRWVVGRRTQQDYGVTQVTQVTSVIMTVSGVTTYNSPFTPAVLAVASQPGPTPPRHPAWYQTLTFDAILSLWTIRDDTNIPHIIPPGIQDFWTLQYFQLSSIQSFPGSALRANLRGMIFDILL